MQTKESLLLGQTGYLFLVFSNNVYMVIISSYNKIKAITHGLDSSYLWKMNEKFFFLIILPHYIEESIGNQDIIQIGEKVSNCYKKYEMYNVLISV